MDQRLLRHVLAYEGGNVVHLDLLLARCRRRQPSDKLGEAASDGLVHFSFFLFFLFFSIFFCSKTAFVSLFYCLTLCFRPFYIQTYIFSEPQIWKIIENFSFPPFPPFHILFFSYHPYLSVVFHPLHVFFFPVSLFHFSFVCNFFPMFSRSVFFPVLVFVFGSIFFS